MISKTKRSMVFLELLLLSSCRILVSTLSIPLDKNVNNISDTAINANIDSDNTTMDLYLSNDIIPMHYSICLTIYPNRMHYFGRSTVHINIIRDTYTIQLHLTNIILFNPILTKIDDIYTPTLIQSASNIWILSFSDMLLRGNYVLSFEFNNTFDGESIFKSSYKTKEGREAWLIASHISIIGAQYVFPCWDEPTLRATFDITIYHPRNYTPLSNMPIQKQEFDRNNMKWTNFQTTPAIPPYLVGITLYDFFNFSYENNFRYRPQSTPFIEFAQMVADNVTIYFISDTWERHLKGQKNWVPMYHVVIPDFRDDSIQHWGLAFYRESDILFQSLIDTVAKKIKIVRLVSHALTHQWFGNRVSPSSWFHLWLNEGIASLIGAEIGTGAFPKLRTKDLLVVQMQQESLRLDTDSIMQPLASNIKTISGINLFFSFSYYIKAPAILRMLQHIITNDVFRKGIDEYFYKYDLDVASLNDFWTVMQDACIEAQMTFTENFNLKNIMDGWITNAYYPVLNVTRHNSSHIKISVENPSNLKNWIPLTLTTEANPDFSIPTSLYKNPDWIRKILLNPETTDYYVPTEEDKWVIVNLQQIGYYRVNYENENWIRLSTYLKSENYSKIHTLNRAQIIDDAFYFLMKGQLALDIFIDLIEYLWQETDFVVWYPMFKALEQISGFFPFEKSFHIKAKITMLLDTLLSNNEIFSDDNLASCLRHEAIIWSCNLGSSDCRKKASHQLDFHHKYHTAFWPGWREWTYCIGLMEENSTIWDSTFNTYLRGISNEDILKFLACSENPSLIINYMKILTSRFDRRIKGYNRVNTFHLIVARHARNIIVLRYMLTNFIKIKPREINTFAALIDIINHVYSNEHLIKIRTFVKEYLKNKTELGVIIIHDYFKIEIPSNQINKFRPYIVKYINKLISFVERKIQMRSLEIEKHLDYFQKLDLNGKKN